MHSIYLVLVFSVLLVGNCSQRLPTTVIPEKYELDISIENDLASYTGTVKITAKNPLVSISTIMLHCASKLTINSVSVNTDQITTYTIDDEVMTIPLGYNRNATFEILIEFGSHFNEDNTGFYKGTYEDSTGNHVFAATHFEATYARTAFPCFDEPSHKANFVISVNVDQKYSVISNMPIKEKENAL